MVQLLADPIRYWDERHARADAWRAGGHAGLSEAENFEFYAFRLGRLVELIRRGAGGARPLAILDAGCGRGFFTDALLRCGHRVTGFDASASAIAYARETYGPHFSVSTLDAYRPAELADVVLCIDVLYHVLDDAVWRESLAAFTRYAAADATIIVSDAFPDERHVPGFHMVFRTASEYDEAFAAADFRLVERTPYRFGSYPAQFALYRRDP